MNIVRSLRAELEVWANALNAYDAEDFTKALELFEPIADTSRILTNIGLILATIGEHERAVENFRRATEQDSCLAIAYFQGGVSSFLLSDYEGAFEQFESAFVFLRGNQVINYEQLGLNFCLYAAEILFNRGLCLLNLRRREQGLADLQAAQKEKATSRHDVIDEAIHDEGDGYTVFSIPVGILFRPNPNKIKDLQATEYLGKARPISKGDSEYQAFDGVDSSELTFRPGEWRLAKAEGANLGRSSSSIRSTLRNLAGLARTATTVAVTAPSRPSLDTQPLLEARPSLDKARSSEPLTRASTVRPTRLQSPPTSRSPQPLALSRPRMGSGVGPVRGQSVRRPALRPTLSPVDAITRDLYDAYLSDPVDSVPSRALSRSASGLGSRSRTSYLGRPPSQYMVRRALSRRGAVKSRGGRLYDEEEGYANGGSEEGEVPFELTKIRVRLHFKDDLRGMAVMPDISYDEFIDRVCGKFGKKSGDLIIRFSDDDGARVRLVDESDFELAIETARDATLNGKGPRLDIWCETA